MSFRQAIRQRPQLGVWAALANPYSAEICAGAGFDWLVLDAEHGPNDLPLVLGQLQAIAAYPVHPVVRLPTNDPVLFKQYLDIGATTVLVPMVETAADAAIAVRATRYPPRGGRGVGSALARAALWNRTPNYLRDADIGVLVQVETGLGIANLAEIARVDGVDGVFLGPSDLAASLGHLGNPHHPDVRAAIHGAVETLLRAEVPAGVLAFDPAIARQYLELGMSFVAVGSDVTLLVNALRGLREDLGRP